MSSTFTRDNSWNTIEIIFLRCETEYVYFVYNNNAQVQKSTFTIGTWFASDTFFFPQVEIIDCTHTVELAFSNIHTRTFSHKFHHNVLFYHRTRILMQQLHLSSSLIFSEFELCVGYLNSDVYVTDEPTFLTRPTTYINTYRLLLLCRTEIFEYVFTIGVYTFAL